MTTSTTRMMIFLIVMAVPEHSAAGSRPLLWQQVHRFFHERVDRGGREDDRRGEHQEDTREREARPRRWRDVRDGLDEVTDAVVDTAAQVERAGERRGLRH